MRSKAFNELIKPTRLVMTILWFALTASVGMYVAVAYLANQGQDPVEVDVMLFAVMAVAALSAGAASLFVPGMMLSSERIRTHMKRGEVDLDALAKNASTGRVDPDKLETLRALSDLEQRLLGLPTLYFTPFVVSMMLGESVAIFGLVLAFIGAQPDLLLPFVGVAVLLMLFRYPKLSGLLARAEKLA